MARWLATYTAEVLNCLWRINDAMCLYLRQLLFSWASEEFDVGRVKQHFWIRIIVDDLCTLARDYPLGIIYLFIFLGMPERLRGMHWGLWVLYWQSKNSENGSVRWNIWHFGMQIAWTYILSKASAWGPTATCHPHRISRWPVETVDTEKHRHSPLYGFNQLRAWQ